MLLYQKAFEEKRLMSRIEERVLKYWTSCKKGLLAPRRGMTFTRIFDKFNQSA